MLKCPYCGSHRLKKTDGATGNPFDRRPEKTVCLDCGRAVGVHPDFECLFQSRICIEISSVEDRLISTAKAEFPYKDGEYDLSRLEYPLCRYKNIAVNGNTVIIDNEIYMNLNDNPCETVKQYPCPNGKHAQTIKIIIKKQ